MKRFIAAVFVLMLAYASVVGNAAPAGLTFTTRAVGRVTLPETYVAKWIPYFPVTGPDQESDLDPVLALGPGTNPAISYAVSSWDYLWRSTNGGSSWTRKSTPREGITRSGTDLTADANGTVYFTREYEHYPAPIWTSFNGGDSWTNKAYAGRGQPCGDNHAVAEGDGHVIHSVVCDVWYPEFDSLLWATVSTNAGATYTERIPMANGVERPGELVIPNATTAYQVYETRNELRIAKSTNGGLTWTSVKIADRGSSLRFPANVAVDDAGNVYVTAVVSGALELWRSTDGGATWPAPFTVAGVDVNVAPSLSAGAAGRLAIAYYSTTPVLDAAGVPLVSNWDVKVATTTDALAAAPAFSTDVVYPANPDPLDGGECCGGRITRIESAIDGAGTLYIAWVRIAPGDPFARTADLMCSVQSAGPKLR